MILRWISHKFDGEQLKMKFLSIQNIFCNFTHRNDNHYSSGFLLLFIHELDTKHVIFKNM